MSLRRSVGTSGRETTFKAVDLENGYRGLCFGEVGNDDGGPVKLIDVWPAVPNFNVITLDYRVSQLWYTVGEPRQRFSELTEFNLETEVLLGEAIFVLNGHDLSWRVDLPLLDFAKGLFMAVMELSPLEPQASVTTADYNERMVLLLDEDNSVAVCPSYSADEATCNLGELKAAAGAFGLRLYKDFVSAYPDAKGSRCLDEWYPLRAMEQTAQAADRH